MKNYPKTLICTVLCCALLLSLTCFDVSAAQPCPEITGSNINDNEYTYYWSSVMDSYLAEADGGYMRVQNGAVEGKYLVEYYSAELALKNHILISEELPIFGGFYATDSNYYILSGQSNPNELASVECFRITKYDLNWKRLGSVGLRDCNTYIPFDAGNARFAEYGKYLFVRTSHEMYADQNGTHHQANVMIQLDTEAMKITDSYTDVMNPQVGYVSHSFNQFIHIDDGKIVSLDHGDAIPRSVVLIKYPTDITTGSFLSWDCKVIDAVEIPGTIGNNRTGVQVGGFEVSETDYLIAYSAVNLDENFQSYGTQNIYVTAVDKETNEIVTHKFTNFTEGEDGAKIPHLVKLSETSFMLMWTQGEDVFYTLLDSNGKATSSTYHFAGATLSDCAPIVANGRVIWYVYDKELTTFYSISTSNPTATYQTEVYSGHKMKVLAYPSEAGGNCATVCEKCGQTDSFKTCYELRIYWNTEGGTGVYTWPLQQTEFKTGDKLYIMYDYVEEDLVNTDKIITFSNNSAITFTPTNDLEGYFTILKPGTHTITVSYKYNPLVSETFTLHIEGEAIGSDSTLGDVNISGAIDMMDYILLKRAYFGTFTLNEEQAKRGDVNVSGGIDMMDYILLKRAYFGTFTIA